ncbi:MAG TPA: hypothetical protein VF426_00970 [Marmoricola sp.]
MSGWWRVNRWWLVVLPIALVAMLAASSYRLKTMWWDSGYHHEIASAGVGRWAHVDESYATFTQRIHHRYRVRADGLSTTDSIPQDSGDLPVPAGVTAYLVHLSFEAATDQDMAYCEVMLVGSDGTVYGGNVDDQINQSDLCLPVAEPDPETGITPTDVPRGRTWTVDPIVLAPSSARIRAVRVTYGKPRYVTLAVDPAASS